MYVSKEDLVTEKAFKGSCGQSKHSYMKEM